MFSFTFSKSSSSSAPAQRRSLGSKVDKQTISFPQAYEWPAFQPQPLVPRRVQVQVQEPAPAPPVRVVLDDRRGREESDFKALGVQLISFRDAKLRTELVYGILPGKMKMTRTTTDKADNEDLGPRIRR
ncbi:uncharacterized protein TRAVEDRAFT_50610 [Trametes versicolor FP-101664 SS1]|uniref:uncharacterized protein n=1 Tax=Trametes versicolor (strain FP-101664) TaxID=717944 RepID=UPI0004621AB3|nr:uncharacterized protein TRAVEDRAFT_50610 [Trametes versicolor FP-101664 SS1]EIW56121.1 hypothetical protein TRAVEDRAFT_50610 [Trametes versicolor FP-101664 SS1]